MKLILHLVGYDLRRMRWWAVAWLLVLAAPIVAVGFVSREGALAFDLSTTKNINVTAILIQVVMAYLIVLVLMEGDVVVGTRQFWTTRPIAGWRLWVAKWLGALAIVGGGAVLVGIPWWLWNGFGVGDLARMSGEYLLLAIAVVAPAMLISALTDSLARAILWSFAFFALVFAALMPLGFGLAPTGKAGAVIILRLMVTASVLLILAIAVAAGIFVTRRRRWCLAAGVLAAAMPLSIGVLWPSGWGLDNKPREMNSEKAAGVQVRFDEGYSSPLRTARKMEEPMQRDQLHMSFVGDEAPDGLLLHGVGASQEWRWPETQFRSESGLSTFGERLELPGLTLPKPDPETQRELERARKEKREMKARSRMGRTGFMPRTPEKGVLLATYSLMPSSWAVRMANEPSAYQVTLWLALLRTEVLNEFPLEIGGGETGDSHRASVTLYERDDAKTAVGLKQSLPGYWTREIARELNRSREFRPVSAEMYVVIDRARKVFQPISPSRQRTVFVHGVEVSHMTVSLPVVRVWRNNAWVDLNPWPKEASLAYVGLRPEAVFTREVRVDGFTSRRDE